MTSPDRLRRVPARRKPRPPGEYTPRQAVADVVRDLLHYHGLTQEAAGRLVSNLSTPTIRRVLRAEPVGDGPLNSLAGILRLPINTFKLMINSDIKALKNLVMLNPDEDEAIKQMILELMGQTQTAPRRRASDG